MSQLVSLENINQIQEVQNPAVLFNNPDVLNNILDKVEIIAISEASKLDATTKKNRKALASVANKVARTKTFLDGLRKDLVSDLKKQAGEIDAQRRQLRNRLDALKAKVRKPLTLWEQAEKDRIMKIQEKIDSLFNVEFVGSSDEIANQIDAIESIEIDDSFAEFADKAKEAKEQAIERGKIALKEKQDIEEAALKAKKAEEAARIERERRIAQEAAAKAEAKAKAEAEARQRAEMRAEQLRKQAEEAKRKAELIKKQVEEARAKKESEKTKVYGSDELFEKLNKAENELALFKKKKEELKKRLADREHVARINREALNGFMTLGCSKEQAKAIVIAIVKNQIPHVKICY